MRFHKDLTSYRLRLLHSILTMAIMKLALHQQNHQNLPRHLLNLKLKSPIMYEKFILFLTDQVLRDYFIKWAIIIYWAKLM